jgi:hypothetical protein
MSEPAQPTSDQPYPPRLWWTKRIALSLMVLVVVLSIVRLWWGQSAHARLGREIATIRAAGEPVTVEDIKDPDVPDAENAAILWNQAMAAINGNVNTPAQSNLEYHDYPPYSDEFLHLLETGVKGNGKALALARQARSRTAVNWKIQFSSPLVNTMLPSLNQARDLANVVGDSALHAHMYGGDFEAVERVRDVRRLSEDVRRQPFLVSYLVAVGIGALALNRLEIIAPELQIETSPQAATREQLQGLVNALLGESEDLKPIHRTMASERVWALDVTSDYSKKARLLTPMFEAWAAEELGQSGIVVHAADQPTRAAVKQVVATLPPRNNELPRLLTTPVPMPSAPAASRISRITQWMIVGSSAARYLEVDLRARAEERLAAVSIAVRMYRVDHGEWPASLDALVPKYLPIVPRDPCATDAPIGYMLIKHGLPDGKDRPVIYSVGDSGDIDVEEKYVPPVPTYDWMRGNIQFRDLLRWSPPASTQPAEQ